MLPLRDDLGIGVDLKERSKRGDAVRRLVRLGVDEVETGSCEHGILVRASNVTVGDRLLRLEAHGAKTLSEGLDALADVIEQERRGRRRG